MKHPISEVTIPESAIDAAVQVIRDECNAAGGMLRLAVKPLERPSAPVRAAVRKAIEAALRAGASR